MRDVVETITFLNKKGGVGKTSLATNLAGAIAVQDESKRVLLIDGDIETNSALNWHMRRDPSRPALGFDVVSQRSAHLSAGTGKYNFFIIDTKAAPKEQDLIQTVEGSQLIIVPTLPDAGSLATTYETIESIRALTPNCMHKVRVLINSIMVQARTQNMDIVAAFDNAGIKCFDAYMNCYRNAYHPASGDGLLVQELSNEQARKAWAQCQAMSREILELLASLHMEEVVHG